MPAKVAAPLLAITLAAGILSAASQQGSWRGERVVRGDTTIVRTVSGSVWRDTMELGPELAIGRVDGDAPFIFGRIAAIDVDDAGRMYALDAMAREVRVFTSAGAHVRTLGRRGSGPGEFSNPNEMRVTRDGQVVVRDQNIRMTIFNSTGVLQNTLLLRSGFSSGNPFFITQDARILNPTLNGRLVWYKLDGTPLDTIAEPQRGAPPPMLQTTSPGSSGSVRYSLAYTPSTVWTLTGAGQLIVGRNDRYEFDVQLAGTKFMRIERAAPPVPVAAAEAERIREETTRNIRRFNDPNWSWNGPEIPRTKPFYGSIYSGTDGSIWVVRYTVSREEKNPDYDAQKPTDGFPTRWVAPVVVDVFNAEGQYMGAVKLPAGVNLYPRPVLSMSRIYAVVEHADGYPQVVRFSVRPRRM